MDGSRPDGLYAPIHRLYTETYGEDPCLTAEMGKAFVNALQQKDENGCVFPLIFGENYWVFGKKEKVTSVFLATDGMYETLFPYLLQGEEVSIYVALAHYMMSEDCLEFATLGEEQVNAKMTAFIDSIPGEQVSDDKTVLVMLDDAVKPEYQPEQYYQTPDWAELKKKRDEEYKRLAYPHLYE